MSDIQPTLLFSHDTYYSADDDDNIYAEGVFPYGLWEERYLPHVSKVTVLGRSGQDDFTQIDNLIPSNGDDVDHILLDNINTPLKRLLQGKKTYKEICALVEKSDCVVVRGPAEQGMMAAKAARQQNKPYVVEMSGCAFDQTWSHGSWIGRFYAPIRYLRARFMVWHADQVLYVTERFLQGRYPTKGHVENASNVDLPDLQDDILERRLNKITDTFENNKPLQIGMIANHGNKLKGVDIAVKALSAARQQGIEFVFNVIGFGDPSIWQPLIEKYDLQNHVVFSPPVAEGSAIFDWLDNIDLYIQPSRHEGLPRAMIEAMSRALPCLGSTAGGIDELIDRNYIHHIGDVKTLQQHIVSICRNKNWLLQQAKRNFDKSQAYTHTYLRPKRFKFYEGLIALVGRRKA